MTVEPIDKSPRRANLFQIYFVVIFIAVVIQFLKGEDARPAYFVILFLVAIPPTLLVYWLEGKKKPYENQCTMKYRDRLRVWESSYGLSGDGWDPELDGRSVAFMDEPKFEDMFWKSFRLTPTTHDPALKERLMSEMFWKSSECYQLVYRNRATGFFANAPFPAGSPFVGPERVNMRGLYLCIRDPSPLDWLVLKIRSLWRRMVPRAS